MVNPEWPDPKMYSLGQGRFYLERAAKNYSDISSELLSDIGWLIERDDGSQQYRRALIRATILTLEGLGAQFQRYARVYYDCFGQKDSLRLLTKSELDCILVGKKGAPSRFKSLLTIGHKVLADGRTSTDFGTVDWE